MKLLRINCRNNVFIVDAEVPVKILGFKIFRFKRVYKKKRGKGQWQTLKGKRPISSYEKKTLNNWLYKHKKFILREI